MLFQDRTVRVPWLSFAKSLPLYALAVAHFTCNWGYYTLLTCLPQYFKHILHFDIKSVSTEKSIFRIIHRSSSPHYVDEIKGITDSFHLQQDLLYASEV